jgi:molybdopterin synthase catalytic subunit
MFHAAIIDPKKTKKRISLLRAEKFIKDFDAGASIFFVGNIRKNNNNKNVTGITYDAFDRLVIKTFKKIYTEGIKKFKLKKAKVFIEHAKGYVTLGKPSIIIAVSCEAQI